jgi:hypothetical protein
MNVQRAPSIPFHPNQCPQCQHYYTEIHRCRAFTTDSWPKPLLGLFAGEDEKSCERFLLSSTAVLPTSALPQSEVDTGAAVPGAVGAMSEEAPEGPVEAQTSPPSAVEVDPSLLPQSVPITSQPVSDAPDAQGKTPPFITEPAGEIPQELPLRPAAPEAKIHCPKCQANNPPNQFRCTICKADLLPGESFFSRVGLFITSLVVAGLLARLAYVLATQTDVVVPFCDGPIQPAFIAIGVLVIGFGALIRSTPRYTRYANRADRHVPLNLSQALEDYTRAIELAPEKERAGLLQKRAGVYEKLGLEESATRDLIAYTYESGAYQTGAGLTTLIGGDRDIYASSRAKDERAHLMNTGRAIAMGYCPGCRAVVELTPALRCPLHPKKKPKDIRLLVPGDKDAGQAEIEHTRQRKQRLQRWRLAITVVGVFTLIWAFPYVLRIFTGEKTPAGTVPAAEAPAQELTDSEVTRQQFEEAGVSFSFPGNWSVIADAERRELLNTTLEGMEDYESIGGVYIEGAGDCTECAHMVVVSMALPTDGLVLTEAQYQDIRVEHESTMGSRLLEHHFELIDSVPAVVNQYIGKSRQTQNWDLMLLVPGENRMILFGCSAHPSRYAEFEPIFAQAMSSLQFSFAPEATPEPSSTAPEPTSTAEPEIFAIVNQSSINVRSGPGTTYAVVGGLARNAEIQVVGRNEAGDWLKIADPQGWVSAALVILPVPVQEIPVSLTLP